jgi:hypothetical protein
MVKQLLPKRNFKTPNNFFSKLKWGARKNIIIIVGGGDAQTYKIPSVFLSKKFDECPA